MHGHDLFRFLLFVALLLALAAPLGAWLARVLEGRARGLGVLERACVAPQL